MQKVSLVLAALALAGPARAQVIQPAESAEARQQERQDEPAPPSGHLPSYQAPAVYETVVRDTPLPRDSERIGEYDQPRWSARRRFPTTRIYVVPAGTATFEYWYEAKLSPEAARDVRTRSQFEMELGLGHRLQLDLYVTTQQQGVDAPMQLHREKVELRYALADWGVLPANPTIYVELARQHDAPPKAELKLLLGGELGLRTFWGVNLVFERVLGEELEHEYVVTSAIAYNLVDEKFSIGAELKLEAVDVAGSRFDFAEYEVFLGPSVQWRPVPPVHVDLVALVGAGIVPGEGDVEGESELLLQPMMVVGYEF